MVYVGNCNWRKILYYIKSGGFRDVIFNLLRWVMDIFSVFWVIEMVFLLVRIICKVLGNMKEYIRDSNKYNFCEVVGVKIWL